MKFINEEAIKKCMLIIIMAKKLDQDPSEHLAEVVKSIS